MKQKQYWQQRLILLRERKKELDTYLKSVSAIHALPYYPNAVTLWQEWTEHGNYPFEGGYFNQPAKWRDDMAYVSAEVERAGIEDKIDHAQTELSSV